ncbi:cupredoxin domain-containing protein [Sphingomonas sp.]|uniref:cupredoxin domain-containing protein n=1 Tax=Sphingomonas sp. TaxID=28214 RepID=UPI00286E9EAB|nr:cupredoxin domain-containing protein [Sphingomonas sp.]
MRPLRFAALAAALLTLAPPASAKKQLTYQPTVTVTLTSHSFAPDPIRLAAGRPVRLVIMNRAGKVHDFTAPRFFRAARMIRGRVPGGAIQLAAGRGATIDLIPARGNYKLHCDQFGHSLLGMKTRIVVE